MHHIGLESPFNDIYVYPAYYSTIALSLILAWLIISCRGKSHAGEEMKYNIRGTITDESGTPLPTARITVYEIWVNANVTDNNDGFEEKVRVLGEANSDDSGRFELTLSAYPGLKLVSINRDGFLEKNTTYLLEDGDTTHMIGPYVLEYENETSSPGKEEEMLIKHN